MLIKLWLVSKRFRKTDARMSSFSNRQSSYLDSIFLSACAHGVTVFIVLLYYMAYFSDESELIVLACCIDWPLNIKSQNVWHIQPCVYMTSGYETQCTAKRSVIALVRGVFFVFIQKLKSKRTETIYLCSACSPANCRSISTSEPGVSSGI